jgi:type IV fimbrial biogenesis protein FimT
MDTKMPEGLTLVELIISLSITVIMLGIAVPSTSTFITSNRIAGQVNDLRGAIALTRSEAIRRNQHVVICKSVDGQSCTRSGRWDSGWMVYIDANLNRKRDRNEQILLVRAEVPEGYIIDYRAFGSRHYVAYRPTGFTRTNGTFYICKPNNISRSRALILTKTGRVRLSKTRPDGKPISC